MKLFLESSDLLETVRTESNKLNTEAAELASPLNPEQLNWKPEPQRWSVAQCLDHLAVTIQSWKPILTTAISLGRKRWPVAGVVPYRPTIIGGWLIKQLLPESTRKLPAPKVFRPASSAIDQPLEHFLEAQAVFLGFVSEAKGLDYNKTRVRSPVTPLLRYSLADSFVVNVVHGQRHLAQARRVLQHSAFP